MSMLLSRNPRSSIFLISVLKTLFNFYAKTMNRLWGT
jgi:hypothetical protein